METSLGIYIWQLRRKLAGAGRIQILNMNVLGNLLKVQNCGLPTVFRFQES